MNKTTEALKLAEEALYAELESDTCEEFAEAAEKCHKAIAAIREALAESKPAPDGRIPKTVFTIEDIGKAAEMGRQAGMIDALAEPDIEEMTLTQIASRHEPVKQEPVALSFPREPKPENAMGWTIDYGLIRQIAEDIGDQEFYPGYEGIELTLMALEHIYTAQVPDRLAAAAPDLLEALRCVVNDWVAPDGLPFEDGEMPALDSARAAIAKATGSQS